MGSKTYAYTGKWAQFDVPAGVEYVTVTLDGGGSGDNPAGRVTGRLKVTGKQTLYILVGGAGKPNSGTTGGARTIGGGGKGGNGRSNDGGNSGGGATAIRLNSTTGMVKAVAAGAGGDSADGGKGGAGGGTIGENGWPSPLNIYPDTHVDGETGNVFNPNVGNATGGTQIQGGNGGTSSAGAGYNGENAGDAILAPAGDGGGDLPNTYGGGGGGGGYHPGGGGQAGFVNETPGGGGAGGANYVGGLISYQNLRGKGGTGNGQVTLTWVEPAPANQPPRAPTEVRVAGRDAADNMGTGSTGQVSISAKLGDPDNDPQDRVRLIVQYSPQRDFSSQVQTETSDLVFQERPKTADHPASNGRASVTLTGLTQNTRYYARLYSRDSHGLRSVNYTSVNFWTNRFPNAPVPTAPVENAQFSEGASVTFSWNHSDPDGSSQRGFELQWRRARTYDTPAGAWVTKTYQTNFNSYVANPGTFQANSYYEWRVRTQDPQGKWGPYSEMRSIFITGVSAPPTPLSPSKAEAVNVDLPVTFKWKFRDPDPGDEQTRADIRYRAWTSSDSEPWFTIIGDLVTPGAAQEWTFPTETFMAGVKYEWQARTQDTLTSAVSGWSDSEYFWAVSTPGVSGITQSLLIVSEPMGALGMGVNRAYIYDRGGQIMRGEVTHLASLTYHRRRDDIANCVLSTNGVSTEDRDFLANLRSWIHEVVIFRDGKRVWEGPITRLTYKPHEVEVEAKDVMNYVYRRIMRQGYNDSFRMVDGVQIGQATVVERATRIIMNALAPDDPNVLPYLTSLDFPDDARQSRSVPDFSRTAWEEVDDLAATAGLDYTTVGRRIMLWDTHRPLGRLPELRDENFSDPPVVTEYGMSLATGFAVTNNNGVWGLVERDDASGPYGIVEQLASAYGETEGGIAEALTSEARENLERTLRRQAERNIAGRYPTPVVVRVPDNSRLHPETPIDFNQLVPGVWIPVRARNTAREVAQWQKLDLVTVEQDAQGERILVTMSPAPNAGEDPDADQAATEAT